eukprot:UN29515
MQSWVHSKFNAKQKGTITLKGSLKESIDIINKNNTLDPVAKKILEYWLPKNENDALKLWFKTDEKKVKEITEEFGEELKRAKSGEYNAWLNEPLGCTALIILLDQISRKVHKDMKKYQGDQLAISVVTLQMFRGDYEKLSSVFHSILIPCLVLTHSESIVHQRICNE